MEHLDAPCLSESLLAAPTATRAMPKSSEMSHKRPSWMWAASSGCAMNAPACSLPRRG